MTRLCQLGAMCAAILVASAASASAATQTVNVEVKQIDYRLTFTSGVTNAFAHFALKSNGGAINADGTCNIYWVKIPLDEKIIAGLLTAQSTQADLTVDVVQSGTYCELTRLVINQ